jgi:hypothetical protein
MLVVDKLVPFSELPPLDAQVWTLRFTHSQGKAVKPGGIAFLLFFALVLLTLAVLLMFRVSFSNSAWTFPFLGALLCLGLAGHSARRLRPSQPIEIKITEDALLRPDVASEISLPSPRVVFKVHTCNLYNFGDAFNPFSSYRDGYACVLLAVDGDEFAAACLARDNLSEYLDELARLVPQVRVEHGEHVDCSGMLNTWWGRLMSKPLWRGGRG